MAKPPLPMLALDKEAPAWFRALWPNILLDWQWANQIAFPLLVLEVGGTPSVSSSNVAVALTAGTKDTGGGIRLTGDGVSAAGVITLTGSSQNIRFPVAAQLQPSLKNNSGTWNARASAIVASFTLGPPYVFTINWDNNAVALVNLSTYDIQFQIFGR